MHTVGTPAHQDDVARPAPHQPGRSTAPHGPAGFNAHLPPGEKHPASFGDAIDDRIAEIAGELLDERNSARQRPGRYISAVSLILAAALAASALLRHSPVAWTIWPSAAVISLATGWVARAGRS